MEKSSFFNSVSGDRKYQASSFAEYFNSLVTNGVFPNPSTNLQVISNGNSTVTIKIGKAWINGYMYFNDTALILPINVADGTLNRIDRVVIRFNTVGRLISSVIKVGSLATTPVAPILQRDMDIFELGIADIYVTKGSTSIVQANITDTRMSTILCGWVNSLIQVDTTAIFNQYQDWFTTTKNSTQSSLDALEGQFTTDWNIWFTSIQSALAGDVAGNLLAKINAVPHIYGGSIAPTTPTSIDFWFKQI